MNRIAVVGYGNAVNPIWLYEIRRCGCGVLALPLVGAAALGLALTSLDAAPVIRSGALAILPLLIGLSAAAALGREQLLELQLTVRTPYPLTVARRVALVLGSGVCAVLPFELFGAPTSGASLAGALASVLALISVATYISVGFGSAAGASALVTTVWLAKVLVLEQLSRALPIQMMLLLALVAVCGSLTALRVADSEPQLQGVSS
ncbi:hypothetical protein ACGFQG_20520 [Nocardia fluminea]|uniref:hypothetical protein n=1 Tax=Nocardia fluminea TaxID=134984 RepID=UPI00371632FE